MRQADFESRSKSDERSRRFADFYTLCIVPGGRNGGDDKRLTQVFYGNRPFDQVTKLQADNDGSIVRATRLLTEHGACLHYQCDDSGRVACLLFPAKTEHMATKEDAIVLNICLPASRGD